MKTQLKNGRLQLNLKTRALAQVLKIDQALISKFENGQRIPTRQQVINLARVLNLDTKSLIVAWTKEKIINDIGTDNCALIAMKSILEEHSFFENQTQFESFVVNKPVAKNYRWGNNYSDELFNLIEDIDKLKDKLNSRRQYDSYQIAQALELEYTFESNRIEGNTLTLRETDLVINEGLTVAEKSMRTHLEAINHQEAINYIKHLVQNNTEINEQEILSIHNLVQRGISSNDAGKYRTVQVMTKGSAHTPPPPQFISKEMEGFFVWYLDNKDHIHPIILAAEMHERLVTIHPFIDANGLVSRLLMNLILLQNGYVIANVKGDLDNRMKYYNTLEIAQTSKNKNDFLAFIAQIEKESLERYLDIIGV